MHALNTHYTNEGKRVDLGEYTRVLQSTYGLRIHAG
jgi:hypothetical protein